MRNLIAFRGLLAAGAIAIAFLGSPPVPSAQQGELQPTSPQTPQPQGALPPSPPSGPVIVLDPAHGGTDTGARGENGAAEKDIVLRIARTVHEQLAQQGRRVLLTRNDDSNPAYDDRAAFANAYRDVIFVSLHASSTGTPGTARVYYDQLGSPIKPLAALPGRKPSAPLAGGLAAWEDAQRSYLDTSHHLADLIQSELAQNFPGSPAASTAAPVRALRSVTAPAVAIELSSVSGSTPDSLGASAGPIGNAISRAVAALRQGSSSGAQ